MMSFIISADLDVLQPRKPPQSPPPLPLPRPQMKRTYAQLGPEKEPPRDIIWPGYAYRPGYERVRLPSFGLYPDLKANSLVSPESDIEFDIADCLSGSKLGESSSSGCTYHQFSLEIRTPRHNCITRQDEEKDITEQFSHADLENNRNPGHKQSKRKALVASQFYGTCSLNGLGIQGLECLMA